MVHALTNLKDGTLEDRIKFGELGSWVLGGNPHATFAFLYVVDYTTSHLCGDYNEPLIWGWPQGSFGRWLEGKTLPETKSKFVPENGCLEYDRFLLGDSFPSGIKQAVNAASNFEGSLL